MQMFNIFKGLKGIKWLYDKAVREEQISEVAKQRAKILDFFNEHGLSATRDAFGISRSTIYRWKKLLKQNHGRLESLNNLSRTPRTKRLSLIDTRIIDFIRNTRKEWPRLGKQKIKPLLDEYCRENNLRSLSISTIGRIIKRYNLYFYITKKRKRRSSGKKKLRRGDYMPKEPGDLGQIDTIVLFDFGIKRFLITYVDIVTRFAFAYCYKSASSKNAEDFMKKLDRVAVFQVKGVQTDNGSEFDKNFHNYITSSQRIHYFNYPKSPKMNPYVERFNRTIQEEFVEVKEVDPYNDIEGFNRELMKYLLFYNTKRVHHGIGNIAPLLYLVRYYLTKKSNMSWTYTEY